MYYIARGNQYWFLLSYTIQREGAASTPGVKERGLRTGMADFRF